MIPGKNDTLIYVFALLTDCVFFLSDRTMDLQDMKRWCVIKDDQYWRVELQEGEIAIECNSTVLSLRDKDGFGIRIQLFVGFGFGSTYFKGYVSIPTTPGFHHLISWVNDHPDCRNMNYSINMDFDLTYSDKETLEYGWDHDHPWEADLREDLALQFGRRVCGPVQLLDEARAVIAAMKDLEHRLCRHRMYDKREEMDSIREELMMKSCHPRRIAAWAQVGFDPFE